MEHLRCVVERITYQNPQNGYSVIKCRAKGFQELVTVVGEMPDVHVGSVLSLGGFWKVDAKYGRQFTLQTFEETLPATVYGMEKYLGSGLIKGIGPKYAQKIVRQFGKDTLDVIEERPEELLKVPGIGSVRVERIKKSWQEQKEIRNIMVFLQGHDVSTSHATKIFKTYGNESIQIVQENPYRLADDIWGIGFRTADTIAEKMGFDHEKYVRLRSGILYTLNKLSEEGHCYAERDQLIQKGTELLSVEEGLLQMTLDEMIRQKDVITEQLPAPAYYQRMCPHRNDLIAVYQLVQRMPMTVQQICTALQNKGMNRCRARMIADIFSELELLEFDAVTETLRAVPVRRKRELNESAAYRQILARAQSV